MSLLLDDGGYVTCDVAREWRASGGGVAHKRRASGEASSSLSCASRSKRMCRACVRARSPPPAAPAPAPAVAPAPPPPPAASHTFSSPPQPAADRTNCNNTDTSHNEQYFFAKIGKSSSGILEESERGLP